MTNEEAKNVLNDWYGMWADGYGTALAHGAKEDKEYEEMLEAVSMAVSALEKQDKYRWHDLRKDPEDLPRINRKLGCSKQVMFEDTDGDVYIGCFSDHESIGRLFKRWHADFCDDQIKNVIAWREIEPFEEEEDD